MESAKSLYPKLYTALSMYAQGIIVAAKEELSVKRPRKYLRAKYRNKRPYKWEIKMSKPRSIDQKENISKSLKYRMSIKNGDVFTEIRGVKYMEYVDKGRYPYMKHPSESGKGLPPKIVSKWTRTKPIKPRDLKTGRFLPRTEKNIRAMNFMINRKIRWFGIEPTNFLQKARIRAGNEYDDKIVAAYEEDIANQLRNL